MLKIFYIFIGGGLGSVLRFLISHYTQKWCNLYAFPLGTFLVNIIGCFIIGIFTSYFIKTDNSLKYLLITGFCGGFTTFSTFSAENVSLWQSQQYLVLFLYVTLSVVLGIMTVALGVKSQLLG